jgi:hypothetical protein
MHLLAQHIEPSDEDSEMANTDPAWNPSPLVDEEDRDRLLNTNTAKKHAPRGAYQLFLERKARAKGVKGFEEWRFRKKVIRWYDTPVMGHHFMRLRSELILMDRGFT